MKGIKPVPINVAIMTDHKFFIKQFRAFSFSLHLCVGVIVCVPVRVGEGAAIRSI